jgi:hypothetical protein
MAIGTLRGHRHASDGATQQKGGAGGRNGLFKRGMLCDLAASGACFVSNHLNNPPCNDEVILATINAFVTSFIVSNAVKKDIRADLENGNPLFIKAPGWLSPDQQGESCGGR